MKLPDFFYIKQTRALNGLHAVSVELSATIYSRNNPAGAYNPEWGQRQLRNLEANTNVREDIDSDTASRILRRRARHDTDHLPEMDRDMTRVETIQANIEQELGQLYLKKAHLIGWIQAGLLAALLAALCVSH